MLVLGHTGITLGVAVLLSGALPRVAPQQLEDGIRPSSKERTVRGNPSSRVASWFVSLGRRIDIRLLLVGSVLPDIIDKPVGQLLFRETFSNGRIFCHTLLFFILITVAGFLLYRSWGKTWLLIFSFGTFIHLILDEMWLVPEILLWPLYGFAFPKAELTDWMQNIFRALFRNPEVYIPEIVGGIILILFLWVLVRNRRLFSFIGSGRLSQVKSPGDKF